MAKNAGAQVRVDEARLSFPAIWIPTTGPNPNEKSKPAYTAHLIVEKPEIISNIKRVIQMVAKEAWGDNADDMIKKLNAEGRISFRPGSTKTDDSGTVLDGYAAPGCYYLSARSQQRPTVVDRDRTPLTEADGKPYSGCYVVAIVRIWAQTGGQYGKRINCQMQGLQFLRDGDSFGGGRVASPDEFESLEEFAENSDDLLGDESNVSADDLL